MRLLVALILMAWSITAVAQPAGKTFRLAAPTQLVETGILDYLIPRFSLKTRIRVQLVGPEEAAELRLGTTAGKPVFRGPEALWHVEGGGDAGPAGDFAQWLVSSVGVETINAFERGGTRPFTAAAIDDDAGAPPQSAGDSRSGERLALLHCGRCHVVSERNRMNAIGSTPSFAVLRTLGDWHARFQIFYTLNPHPAFTQVADVTEPFSKARPPPIVPIELTLEDVEAILAYVTTLAPADLGAPIRHQ